MRVPSFAHSLTRRRAAIVATVLVLVATGVAIVTRSGDDDVTVRAESDESTSTTDEATTSTSAEPTTTSMIPASTTSIEPVISTLPPTTAPPTTAPPPSTAPPPTSLDMVAVLAFAKAGVGTADPPRTYTGATVCSPAVDRQSDAGDDAARDIGMYWYLIRYCSDVYRAVLATTSSTPALDSFWVQADTTAGGCEGIDRVVIGWHTTGPRGGLSGMGAVVATPGCDAASWRWVDAALFPVYNGSWLQLDFRNSALGSPSAFDWSGAVRAVGETGSAIDVVPNGGPEHFVA